MKIRIETGDPITLLPTPQLLEVLIKRKFFSSDGHRREVADEFGGKTGFVKSVEEKYAFDYFTFLDGKRTNVSEPALPYEAIESVGDILLSSLNKKK